MAAPDVIKYVIIHELAHIKEKNHGKRFWTLVEQYEPEYKAKKEKLRQLGIKLDYNGWE